MKKILIGVVAFSIILAGCSTGAPSGGEEPEKAVAIAKCLDDKGVKMYGAFWCPHCADQKKIFGKDAENFMPYNECDARGENPVTELCLELNIERYPTWIYPDNTREVGAISLTALQEKGGCSDSELSNYT